MDTSPLQPNPLPEEQQTTPAGKSRPSHVLYVQFNAERVMPILSVQQEFNLSNGIRRGFRDYAGRPMMDHVIGPRGQKLFGNDMRTGTVSVWEHQIRLLSQKAFSNHFGLAVVGNGNLTQNPYFIAWQGQSGKLFRLADEPIGDRTYDCIVVADDGRCSIESIRFETSGSISDEAGWRAVNALSGKELPYSTQVAFSGQRIVKDGKPLSADELNAQILAGLYYDLRHVFRFPAIKCGNYWKDVGLEQFYDHGSINRLNVAQALAGTPIRTRWRDLTDDKQALRKAFFDKGCIESSNGMRGTFCLQGDYVDIVYAEGIYCHNVLGLDRDGNLVSMQVTGWSNNTGASLGGLSTLAAKVFQDAILLDNGGDVFFLKNEEPHQRMIPYVQSSDGSVKALVESCEKRYFIRSVIFFATTHATREDDLIFKRISAPEA